MPLDFSLLNAPPIDVLGSYQRGVAASQQNAQNQMQQMEMIDKMKRKNALADILKSSGGDVQKAIPQLLQGGFTQEAAALHSLAPKPAEPFTLNAGDTRYSPAGQPIITAPPKPSAQPDIIGSLKASGIDPSSPQGQQIIRQHYAPIKEDNTLVSIVGPDNNPVLVPRSQAKGQQPYVKPSASLNIENSPAYKSGIKQLEKDDSQIAQAQALTNSYQRWAELQPQVETGPIAGRRPISFDTNYQELKQLENYLTMNNFKPGQGSISNTERAFMKGSGPNTINHPETNMDIVNIGMGAAQNMKDRANFREQYLTTKGNLFGSEAAWQKYLDDNPRYIADEKTKRMIENTNRIEWNDYFAGNKKSTQPRGASGGLDKQKTQSGVTISGW